MKQFFTCLLVGCLLLGARLAMAQQSTNTVDYQVTYNVATGRYIAWVIPNYATPNANNPSNDELGGTAQFTIKVPSSFSITNIQDLTGSWDKTPLRLGPGNPNQTYTTALDPNYNYFVIGKSPNEVNYGKFTAGTPVPLFSFTGNGCFGEITPLAPGDPFIAAADNDLSLNVANSFYSRSGQPAGGNQAPLEQFRTLFGPAAQCAVLQANPDSQTLTAGIPVSLSVLANDTRNGVPVVNTDVTVTVSTPPASGTATVNPDGTISYSPAAGYSGPVSFTYTLCAPTQTTICSTASVSLTVNAVLVASPDQATTNAGTPVAVAVLGNDTRNGGPASTTNVTVSVSTAPATGTATVNANGTITYTPATGFSGPVSFTYTICDIDQPLQCSSAAVSLTVNTVIVTSPDAVTTASGTPISVSVLANDTRNSLPALSTTVSVALASAPANGTAVVNANGTITYTPAIAFSGNEVFTYTVCDLLQPLQCSTNSVTVTVQPSRPAPQNDFNQTFLQVAVSGNVLTNDKEPAGLALTVTTTPVVAPTNGTLTLLANGNYTYTPATSFTGTDSFVYQVCNTAAQCATALVTIEVRNNAPNNNDAPIAQNDLIATTPNSPVVIAVRANDSDPDAQTLGLPILVSAPTNGNIVINPNGTITYTPVNSFTGVDSFVYQVCDTGLPILCDQATVTVLVRPNPANNQTLAYDDAYSTFTNTAFISNVLTNDQDLEGNNQTVTTTPVTSPTNGTLALSTTGSFTYTPAAGFSGTDSFVYQVCDTGTPSACATATVYLTVFPPNGAVDLAVGIGQPLTSLTATLSSSLPISVSNIGTGNFSGPVTVTLTMPAGVTIAPGFTTSNGFVCTVLGQLVSCVKSVSLATLTSETLTIPILPGLSTVGQPQTFTVATSVPAGDNTPANNVATVTTPAVIPAPIVRLSPKVYLQGALFGVTGSLMRDDLRVGGYIPASHPYTTLNPITPITSIAAGVTAVTGNDAIVDWVFVELRSEANPATIVDSRAALLQRDGDIVGVDGVSSVTFATALSGNYYVAVRHRNHLGVMSQSALPLSETATVVDFRNPNTPTFTYSGVTSYTEVTPNQAQVVVSQGVAMWAGNAFVDNAPTTPRNFVIYQGSNNDVNQLYQLVINAPNNGLVSPAFKLRGYFAGDINLDGQTIFQGTGNDVEFIYQNVIKNHPGNSFRLPFFTIREQLP
ncbi:Ig-like domain-containing protein [Rudanella lutea]|uniref:Ig-like domain-containing protein n=1 Tax=Rudanella lutea TaxID=451374 RepID=UPI00036CA88C|nr:Ig-like domain-containing protein [Rudanella lutea]